jgi:AraC-like DNA-binding protein
VQGDLVSAALLACGVQSLVLTAALWRAQENRVAARRLALALVVIVGMTMVHVLGGTGRAMPEPLAAFFPLNLPLALGPLLYGYVHALASGLPPTREWRHYLPAVAQFLYLVCILLLPAPTQSQWREQVHDDLVKPLLEVAVLVSLAAYSLAGLDVLRLYRRWLVNARSDVDRHAGHWVGRILVALLATLSLLALVRAYTWSIGELETGWLQLWYAAWSAWLGIEGWRHAGHAYPPMDTPTPASSERSVHDWAAQGECWRQATEAAGWWRQPDLSLAELARRLGTNTSYLSRAVNEGLSMNFNGFINLMRAREVARRIEAGDGNGDLLALALEAGFSSKATFNRAFRSAFGMSPSEFRRRKS